MMRCTLIVAMSLMALVEGMNAVPAVTQMLRTQRAKQLKEQQKKKKNENENLACKPIRDLLAQAQLSANHQDTNKQNNKYTFAALAAIQAEVDKCVSGVHPGAPAKLNNSEPKVVAAASDKGKSTSTNDAMRMVFGLGPEKPTHKGPSRAPHKSTPPAARDRVSFGSDDDFHDTLMTPWHNHN